MNVICPCCQNPTTTLNDDGMCPRCESGRVSSPPPLGAKTDVAKSSGKSYHVGKLDRDRQVSAKIPLEKFLAGNPDLAPSRAAADSSST